MVSVLIVHKNDPFLWFTINALLRDTDHSKFEIIIVDDGSDDPLKINTTLYPNVRVIHNIPSQGVGHSFDRGVEVAQGDIIILTASDVIVKDSTWLQQAIDYATNYRGSLGCSVCLSLDPRHLDPNFPADDVKRYGATTLPFFTTDDLRSDSPLLDTTFYEVGLFENKWIKKKPVEDITEVPAIYGAFYVTIKAWYNTIHGWDTVRNMKLSGHSCYGGLEPWISIKSWLGGGRCHILKTLETGHVFHKFERENTDRLNQNTRDDLYWYNKFFIAYTMLPKAEADKLINKVYDLRIQFDLFTMQFNVARKLIQGNWDYVMSVKNRNEREFTHSFDWYCEKFDILKRY